MSHWVDLVVHYSHWQINKPSSFIVEISNFDPNYYDENLSMTITSDNNFTATIVFLCLSEPFSGVHEYLQFSNPSFTARINNFLSLDIDYGDRYRHFK